MNKVSNYDDIALAIYQERLHVPTLLVFGHEQPQVIIRQDLSRLKTAEAKGMLWQSIHDNHSQYGILIFEEEITGSLVRMTYYKADNLYNSKVLATK